MIAMNKTSNPSLVNWRKGAKTGTMCLLSVDSILLEA